MRSASVLPILAAIAACSGDVTNPGTTGSTTSGTTTSADSTSTGPMGCVPGQQVACACVGGGQGAQVCSDDGTHYGPCSCATGTGGSGGTGGGPTTCTPGAVMSCYEGPAGTEGVGICKSGQATCKPDGSGFGPCAGQVLPQTDLCSTPEDEDCDGKQSPCQSDLSWCHGWPVPQSNYLFGLGTDAARDVYLGLITQDLSLGNGTPPLTGPAILKLDKSGNVLWGKAFPSISPNATFAVGADGSVALAGTFVGTLDLGVSLLACPGAGSCPFLAKLAPDGSTSFARVLFGTNATGGTPTGMAVDANGNIAMTGTLAAGTTFECGAGPVTAGPSAQDVFFARFTPAGTCSWSKTAGTGGSATPTSVSFDGAGNLVMSGYFFGSVHFGATTLTSMIGMGASYFLARLDPAGAPLFARSFVAGTSSNTVSAAADATGNITLTGTFNGTIDLGGGPFTSTPAGDMFVAGFDPSGTPLWSHDYGSGSTEHPSGAAKGPGGETWVSGYFQNLTDLGSGSLKSAGTDDVFLAKYGPNGAGLVSFRYGDAQEQYGIFITANTLGTPIIAGLFLGTVDFGMGPLTATAGQSVFLCQLAQ